MTPEDRKMLREVHAMLRKVTPPAVGNAAETRWQQQIGAVDVRTGPESELRVQSRETRKLVGEIKTDTNLILQSLGLDPLPKH